MNKNIVLIGMPGSGKSTLGCKLSQTLNMEYVDIDVFMEANENKSIKEMFEISEDFFRDMETKYSAILSKLNSHVISTGGGIVKRQENLEYFKDNSVIVFINRPVECILEDIKADTRPLLAGGKDRLFSLYKERIDLYKKYCHIEILNDGSIYKAINKIVEEVKSI
jgi:shikimate kinase